MSLIESIARAALRPKLKEFGEALRAGHADRGAWIIRQAVAEFPLATDFIKTMFTGTPAEVVKKVSRWWPEVVSIPQVEVIAGKIQADLQREWTKQR